jgi:hypothetical protein
MNYAMMILRSEQDFAAREAMSENLEVGGAIELETMLSDRRQKFEHRIKSQMLEIRPQAQD